MYKIRATRNAIKSDYVKIISTGPRKCAATYSEFQEYRDEELDFDHYKSIVNSCLDSICKCIGLKDGWLIRQT